MSTPNGNQPAHEQARAPDGAVAGYSRLDVAGYILAFVLPIFGLAVGIVLVRRTRGQSSKHGVWIIAISLIVGVLFVAALIANAHIGVSEGE
jgi:uncharacterized membrane protein